MAVTSPEFDKAFEIFLNGCQELLASYFKEKFPTLATPKLVVEVGTRYIRIIQEQDGFQDSFGFRKSSRNAFAFVDSLNGDILKPASWKAPAKHARGNIFDPNPLARMTVHGPEYMK